MKSWKLVIVAASALSALAVGLPWKAADVGVDLASVDVARMIAPAS
jgi:hypothetical protein